MSTCLPPYLSRGSNYIGKSALNPGELLQGEIRNVFVWGRALSQSEVLLGILNEYPRLNVGRSLILSSRSTHYVDTNMQVFGGTNQEAYINKMSGSFTYTTSNLNNDPEANAAADDDHQTCVAVEVEHGGRYWWEASSENSVNIDSVTLYGESGSKPYSSNISIYVTRNDETSVLCASGVNIHFFAKVPASRSLCNVRGKRLRVEAQRPFVLCETSIFSIDSLTHMKVLNTRMRNAEKSINAAYSVGAPIVNSGMKFGEFFYFFLRYPGLEGIHSNLWKQSSSPADNIVTDYIPIDAQFTANGWNGVKTDSNGNMCGGEYPLSISQNCAYDMGAAAGYKCGLQGPWEESSVLAMQFLVQRAMLSTSNKQCGELSEYTVQILARSTLPQGSSVKVILPRESYAAISNMNLQVLLGNTEIDVSSSITVNDEENSFEITTTVDEELMVLKIVGVANPSTAGRSASMEVVMINSGGDILDKVDYGLSSNIVCDSGSTIRVSDNRIKHRSNLHGISCGEYVTYKFHVPTSVSPTLISKIVVKIPLQYLNLMRIRFEGLNGIPTTAPSTNLKGQELHLED